jgi:hypothetical protein
MLMKREIYKRTPQDCPDASVGISAKLRQDRKTKKPEY